MQYHPVRIVDVMRELNRLYFLPDIQREFVWGPEKVERLFDSIMGDFPIGAFLFWKVLSEHKNDWNTYEFIKDFDDEHPHNDPVTITGDKDIYLILDGQQRLTSLYIGLQGSYRFFYYRWRKTHLHINILKTPIPNEDDPEEPTYQFEFLEDEPLISGELEHWYKVSRILDFEDPEDAKADIEKEIAHLTDDQQTNAKKLVGRLHSRIHTVTVINYYEEKSQDYDKVLNIFVRANSEGKPLEYSDLLLSTATAKWDKLNAREEISKFTDTINNIGSGYRFGKDFVLKGSLYLTEDLPIQYKVKNFNRPNLIKIENNWENIKSYIEASVRLISKFGFNSKNLTAPISLLPIAFFFMKTGNKNFDKSSEQGDVQIQHQIRRWIVCSLLRNAFGSSTDTRLKNVREFILGLPNHDAFPVDGLNATLKIEDNFNENEVQNIIGYKYQSKYSYLVLSLLYPDRYWKDQVFHEDHIFPKSEFQIRQLKKRDYDDEKIQRYQDSYNTVANLQLLTDFENLSKNATPFEEWITTRDEEFKTRHIIPELEDYSMDNYETFIIKRKSMIADVLQRI